MKLIDNGDGTGSYRGWALTMKPCDGPICRCGELAWFTTPPYELEDGGRAIWGSDPRTIWGSDPRTIYAGVFARHVPGDWNQPCPTIESVIDIFEAARERLMAAAFAQDGPDDSARLVRIPRPVL